MSRVYLATAIAAVIASTAVGAQTPSTDTTSQGAVRTDAPSALVAGSTFAAATARLSAASNEASAVPASAMTSPSVVSMRRADSHESNAMMIVGAVGLVVGAVIGGKAGTIIMIGGAGVGLLGLWDHLK